jgi:hypothetical protein
MKTILIFLTLIIPQILFSQIVESEIVKEDILTALEQENIYFSKIKLILDTTNYYYTFSIEEYKKDSLISVDYILDKSDNNYSNGRPTNYFRDTTEFRFINTLENDSTYSLRFTINKYSTMFLKLSIEKDIPKNFTFDYFWRIQELEAKITEGKTPIAVLSQTFSTKDKNDKSIYRQCLWGGAENLKSLSNHIYVFYLEKIPKVKN